MKKKAICGTLSVLVIVFLYLFMPSKIIQSSDNITIRTIYFCENIKDGESSEITLNRDGTKVLLTYLDACKKYRTLYDKNVAPSYDSRISADDYYLYINLEESEKDTGIHISNKGIYITIENDPCRFYFVNDDEVKEKIKQLVLEKENQQTIIRIED